MREIKITSNIFLQLLFITVLIKFGTCVLNLPTQPLCQENNLQLVCKCNYGNPNLYIPTFKINGVHYTSISSITVQNCANVTIGRNAIEELRSLRYLSITNIDNLQLEEESFNWPGYSEAYPEPPSVSITISNARIQNVPRLIKGKLTDLSLRNVIIDRLQPYAFSSVSKMRTIEITNCTFKKVEAQAFKILETEKLIISDSVVIGILPSRSFLDIDVTDSFKIVNCDFDIVKPSAFVIKQPKYVEISNSRFNSLEIESFKISAKGPVVIRNNYFKNLQDNAFKGISLIKEHRAAANQDLTFDNNKLNEMKYGALVFDRTSYTPKYGPIIVNQTCTCMDVQIWISNDQWEQQIHCVIDNRKFLTTKAVSFKESECDSLSTNWILIISVICGILLVLIIVTVALVFIYRKYKKEKQKELINRGQRKNGSLGLIVPDGRTYKETEVHVIIEKAELLTTEL